MNGHRYTPEQDAWLREHSSLSRAELCNQFNSTFGTSLTLMSISRYCIRHRILTGRTGRFEDGHVSWQTGVHGEDYWSHFTDESRAGVISRIAPKSVYSDGEIVEFPSQKGKRRVCCADDKGRRTYRCMTGIIWEKANGPLPADFRLIHLDGDETNDELDNIRAIPKSWMSILANLGGLTFSRELNEAKLAYCELFSAIKHSGR